MSVGDFGSKIPSCESVPPEQRGMVCGNLVLGGYISSGHSCASTKIETPYTWIYSSNISSNPIFLCALSVPGWTESPPAAAASLPTLSLTGWWSFAQDGAAAETFWLSPYCWFLLASLAKCTLRTNNFSIWAENPVFGA